MQFWSSEMLQRNRSQLQDAKLELLYINNEGTVLYCAQNNNEEVK